MDNKVNFVINGYKFDESSFKLDDYIVYDITPSIDLQNYIMAKMTKNIVPQFEKSMSWMDKYITFPEELITELQDPNSLTYNRIATIICASTKYGIEKIEPGIITNDNKSIMQLKASFSADTLEDDITFHNYKLADTNGYEYNAVWFNEDGSSKLMMLPNKPEISVDELKNEYGYVENRDTMLHIGINIHRYSIHSHSESHKFERYGNMWEITYHIYRSGGEIPTKEKIISMATIIHDITSPSCPICFTKEFSVLYNNQNHFHKDILKCETHSDSNGELAQVKIRLYTNQFGNTYFCGDSNVGIIDMNYTPTIENDEKMNFSNWDYLGLVNTYGLGKPRNQYMIPFGIEVDKNFDHGINIAQIIVKGARIYEVGPKMRFKDIKKYRIAYSRIEYMLNGLIFYKVKSEYSDDPFKIDKFLDIDLYNTELRGKKTFDEYVKYIFNKFKAYYTKFKDKYYFIPLADSKAQEIMKRENFPELISRYPKIAFALVRKGQNYNGHELSEGLAWFLS